MSLDVDLGDFADADELVFISLHLLDKLDIFVVT